MKRKLPEYKTAKRVFANPIRGQMADLMSAHPEWFTDTARQQYVLLEENVERRIVGEIAVALMRWHRVNVSGGRGA